MTIDNIRLRNEFVNTQVITREEGKKLGVVKDPETRSYPGATIFRL